MDKINLPRITLGLAVVAAIIYNLWILGFILYPNAIHNSYISSLDIPNKPYYWLFIAADMLTAVLVIIVGLILKNTQSRNTKIIIGYICFGIATFFEALLPITGQCSESISACGISPSQVFTPHDIASIFAAISLFYSLLLSLRHIREHEVRKEQNQYISITFWLYCLAALFLVFSVAVDNYTTISQAFFLIVTGVGLIVIPKYLLSIDK